MAKDDAKKEVKVISAHEVEGDIKDLDNIGDLSSSHSSYVIKDDSVYLEYPKKYLPII